MTDIKDLQTKILTDHFVNGSRVQAHGKERYRSCDPATGALLAEFNLGDSADIDRAVSAARAAFDSGPWPRMSVKERAAILRRFADLIEQNAELLGAIESYDVGKLLGECVGHDVARAAANLRFFSSKTALWEDEAFFNDATFLGRSIKTVSLTKRDPIGVAGLIVPWNSPIMLSTWKIGPCLATGNTCVVKPSPWALLSVLQLGELANKAGLPPGVLNIVPGGVEAGKALVAHPGVNRISFTGSVAAGKAVNRSNAEVRLAPVSLELGGKSPTIVFKDADLSQAVEGVARGIFRSQGQSCVAGSRLLVQQEIYDSFLEQLKTFVAGFTIGPQTDPKTVIGPLITSDHLERVVAMLSKATSEGAVTVLGGKRPSDPKFAKGNYLEPTILTNLSAEMEIWQEEVFGPVLVVMPFTDQADALAKANNCAFGLSSSIWTSNIDCALQVATALEAGMTWVNSHFVRDLRAPFGGHKESGIGSEGGNYSIEFYTKPKMICLTYPKT